MVFTSSTDSARSADAGISTDAKIAVLVSGGVDSALALSRLKRAGYAVEAFYLKIWLQDEFSALGACPWEEDLAYLRPLTAELGVPLHVVPFQEQYWNTVITHTIERIKLGETPNPDILCNALVKFGAFVDGLTELLPGWTQLASGHYAQIRRHAGRVELHTSPDPVKDQTYFLASLQQAQLRKLCFPIGHLTKAEVRAEARAAQLPNQARKDSQGLCFLGKINFRDFLRFHLGEKAGKLVVAETGAVMGEHKGFWYYTIGQRQGLDLSTGPWYVTAKNVAENIVYISRREHVWRRVFTVRAWQTLSAQPEHIPNVPTTYHVKLRHGSSSTPCTVAPIQASAAAAAAVGAIRYNVTLATADAGITPGQYAVFYRDSHCLASAIISEVPPISEIPPPAANAPAAIV